MKTVLLLGGPAAGQRTEVHGCMRSVLFADTHYELYPLASHGEVHWFGVLDGADPLALLIAGYMAAPIESVNPEVVETAIIERWEQQRPKYGDRPLTNGIVNFMLDFMGVKKLPGVPGDPTAFTFGGHK